MTTEIIDTENGVVVVEEVQVIEPNEPFLGHIPQNPCRSTDPCGVGAPTHTLNPGGANSIAPIERTNVTSSINIEHARQFLPSCFFLVTTIESVDHFLKIPDVPSRSPFGPSPFAVLSETPTSIFMYTDNILRTNRGFGLVAVIPFGGVRSFRSGPIPTAKQSCGCGSTRQGYRFIEGPNACDCMKIPNIGVIGYIGLQVSSNSTMYLNLVHRGFDEQGQPTYALVSNGLSAQLPIDRGDTENIPVLLQPETTARGCSTETILFRIQPT